MLGVLNLLGVSVLGRVLLLCIRMLQLLLMLSVPVLLHIFTNEAIQSPSTSLLSCCSWTGPWLVSILGFCFYCRWVGLSNDAGRGVSGRGYWPIFPYLQKIAGHLSSSWLWSPSTTGASSSGGELFSKLWVADSLSLLELLGLSGCFLGVAAWLCCLN